MYPAANGVLVINMAIRGHPCARMLINIQWHGAPCRLLGHLLMQFLAQPTAVHVNKRPCINQLDFKTTERPQFLRASFCCLSFNFVQF